ncbi:MAG TPA: hypothetical protein DDZ38_10310 [Gammaproteobacteria bacterium]|nr:hypothetical protein [Gammaproteobacteria bacterium]|tara:strand:+ start:7743 stop:8912 length:1170 start_codon:yes stop_codon:yes gene_type:complete
MTGLEFPLQGLRVLDFSRVLAGPFAGRMLSDLGADVVKVEPPDGDITRLWGKDIGGLSGYFYPLNAGKRNVCIDLRAEGARELVLQLVREVDVVIENYRPDVMPRLGLGFDALRAVNSGLIMLSISGFGRQGPESRKPAYAPIIHAESGLMHRQASRADVRLNDLPLSVADTNAGLHGLVALLAAVIMRHRTGAGQHIDIAMIDSTVGTDDQLQYDMEDAEDSAPMPNEVWQTGAGAILIAADFRQMWRQLTGPLGVADPTTKETPLEEKIRTRRQIFTEYLAGLEDWPAVEGAMQVLDLPWGRVRDPAHLEDQPTLAARASIVQMDDRVGGTRPITQSPYRFSDARSGIRGPAPYQGEHNANVIQDWLGFDEAQAADLFRKGILHGEA